jgi:hypothetical protein
MRSDPYSDQIRAQGREPSNAPAARKTFPCKIGRKVFETEEQYLEELHEFLNGM